MATMARISTAREMCRGQYAVSFQGIRITRNQSTSILIRPFFVAAPQYAIGSLEVFHPPRDSRDLYSLAMRRDGNKKQKERRF